uniref:Uncharacterized protein n=1 Tax=Romanomermis culicivorax TaxID=13658 RepID=A0A915HZU4_ROMCU
MTHLVENDDLASMCERLIQVSFSKIVSSKSERGGAKLRKNLLILHLLQRARTEQKSNTKNVNFRSLLTCSLGTSVRAIRLNSLLTPSLPMAMLKVLL